MVVFPQPGIDGQELVHTPLALIKRIEVEIWQYLLQECVADLDAIGLEPFLLDLVVERGGGGVSRPVPGPQVQFGISFHRGRNRKIGRTNTFQ